MGYALFRSTPKLNNTNKLYFSYRDIFSLGFGPFRWVLLLHGHTLIRKSCDNGYAC